MQTKSLREAVQSYLGDRDCKRRVRITSDGHGARQVERGVALRALRTAKSNLIADPAHVVQKDLNQGEFEQWHRASLEKMVMMTECSTSSRAKYHPTAQRITHATNNIIYKRRPAQKH